MNPNQLVVPVGRGRNPEGYLKVVDSFLSLALGMVCFSKDTVALTDRKNSPFPRLREEIDRPRRGLL